MTVEGSISAFLGTIEWDVSFGNGLTTKIHAGLRNSTTPKSGLMAYSSSTVLMVAKKQSNGGIAQDNGTVQFIKNSSAIDSQNFSLGDNLSSGLFYNMTGVVAGDVLEISISEG